MKLMWFHLMPYTELPDDFREKHPSVWVDIHSSLCDPKRIHRMYNDFMDELEYAAEVGFDWPSAVTVTDKIAEESRELAEAASSGDSTKVHEEFGDLFESFPGLRHSIIELILGMRLPFVHFQLCFNAGFTKLPMYAYRVTQQQVACSTG